MTKKLIVERVDGALKVESDGFGPDEAIKALEKAINSVKKMKKAESKADYDKDCPKKGELKSKAQVREESVQDFLHRYREFNPTKEFAESVMEIVAKLDIPEVIKFAEVMAHYFKKVKPEAKIHGADD